MATLGQAHSNHVGKPSFYQFARTDHWPFAQQDVPSLFFSTGLHPEYHTPADTPEKIHYEKMEKIARLAYRALWASADADPRPAFQPIPLAHPR